MPYANFSVVMCCRLFFTLFHTLSLHLLSILFFFSSSVTFFYFFFFNVPATTEIYTSGHTLSLHDARPSSADDAIFTVDVGAPTVWAARYLQMTRDRRLLGSFNHGSMASAMPQAIGAQLVYPGRQVVSLSGDGGFAMMMGDILTISQYDLPVKIVIFNNSSLGFVAMEMKVAGLPPFGTHLKNQDFAKMAEAIGIKGIRAEKPEDISPALHEAFSRTEERSVGKECVS